MSDIKSDFREWLQEQKYSQSTIKQYFFQIDKICSDCYESKDWYRFSEDASYLLAKYTEYANREYYLDVVTIRYALDYFDDFREKVKISAIIKSKEQQEIKLFLYFDKQPLNIANIRFDELYDYLSILNTVLYERPETKTSLNLQQIENFTHDIKQLLHNHLIKNSRKIAVYIKYPKKNATTKLALSKYCSFIQAKQPNNKYSAMLLPVIANIKTKNPSKTVNGHYKIVQQISGNKPLIIEADNAKDRLDINYTITKQDLVVIFDLDFSTVDKLLKKLALPTNKTAKYDDEDYKLGVQIAKATTKRDVIFEYETELRTYYNADNINEYLSKHHHCHHYKEVDYSKEGYKYWCNKERAIEMVGVGKTAFFEHIWGISKKDKDILSVSYINYTDFKTRYYEPEMKFLKTHPIFKRILYKK